MKGRNPRRAEGHPGQVVPLDDAKKILELAEPILRVNCACRHMTRGIKDPCCIAFGALAEMVPKLPRYIPDRGADPLHVDEAKAIQAVKDLQVIDEAARRDPKWAAWRLGVRYPDDYGEKQKANVDVTTAGRPLAIRVVYEDRDASDPKR